MKKIALIGYPAKHSLSPLLFDLFYTQETIDEVKEEIEKYYLRKPTCSREVKIGNESYIYIIKEDSSLDEAIKKIREDNEFISFNITSPYKEQIVKLLNNRDTSTQEIEACNLVQIDREKGFILNGYNTDFYAIREILQKVISNKSDALPKKVYIIGAGGVAKAAAYCAKILNLECVITNRDREKGERLANKYTHKFISLENFRENFKGDKGVDKIVIYTLPLNINLLSNDDLKGFSLIEPNYKNPAFKNGEGYFYYSGVEWLIEQAITGFEIMTGKKVDKNKISLLADLIKLK